MSVRCFSGMGNSAAVAARLELLLPTDFPDEVYVFPVYSWGLPPVMVRHLESASLAGRRVHMVCTCGDDVGLIDRQWTDLITARGAIVGSMYSVQMPNTYVCLPFMDIDPESLAARKLTKAAERVDHIASRLKEGVTETDLCRGVLPRFKSRVVYPWFFRRLMKSSKFHATPDCKGCGRCAAACPMDNITPGEDGKPTWGDDCTYCLRCYHTCPGHAVAYGKQTRRKGQYLNPDYQWVVKKFKNI